MTSDPSSKQPTSEYSGNELDAAQLDSIEALFPVVGVAASAGGLEAFTQLLSHLPTDTGMAFVLIQHLSPDHDSLLTEILTRSTQLPVRLVQNGMTVEPNQVYVIPPNTKMILSDGVLKLSPREKVLGKYMPGDAFFTSLAAERGYKAIAVVLSGADGDGSLGLMAIKAAGGVTFAQCEKTAKFDSMPNTAVATGDVDFVLPPAEIASELANLSRHPMLALFTPPSDLEPTAEEPLKVVSQEVPSLEGLHILAVDDDVDNLDLMKYIWENTGAEVVVVNSVKSALAALMASPGRYDVLCADIGMADEDGFSLIRQVRALSAEAGGQIPAAAITAYASVRERQQAINAGFQMHLAKPVNPSQLIRMVATLTGRVRDE